MSVRRSARIQRRVDGVDYRDIEEETLRNRAYRRVVYTAADRFQLVLMCLAPGETIPGETHADTVQFVRVESGRGECVVGRGRSRRHLALHDGIAVTVPSGAYHQFVNTSDSGESLQMYVIYTPAEHASDRLQQRQ